MKHPSEATLALFAGGDLGLFGRWQTERHVAGCARCRAVVEEFAGVQEEVIGLRELPGLPWGRLAGEMKANIRLGLEAGECVRDGRAFALPAQHAFPGWRALVACVSMVALVVAGVLLEHPAPAPVEAATGTVLRATMNGIELSEDGQVLSLLHRRAKQQEQEVTYFVGAQGSMAARYVDADTGYVTVNNVYGQ
jgi:hypothetical protein